MNLLHTPGNKIYKLNKYYLNELNGDYLYSDGLSFRSGVVGEDKEAFRFRVLCFENEALSLLTVKNE